MQAAAGSRYSYQYGTSYHEYSYISRTRGRSYGTVGAAMRPRCGDPPNKVCTAVGKLDTSTVEIKLSTTLRVPRTVIDGNYGN